MRDSQKAEGEGRGQRAEGRKEKVKEKQKQKQMQMQKQMQIQIQKGEGRRGKKNAPHMRRISNQKTLSYLVILILSGLMLSMVQTSADLLL